MDQAEASGKTVEDALNRAIAQLGASRDEVEFVVLDEGKRGGLFGRGAKDAMVRVERIVKGSGRAPAQDRQAPDTRMPRGGAEQAQGGPQGRGRGSRGAPRADSPGRPAREGGPDARGAAANASGRGRAGGGAGARGQSQSRTGFDAAVPKLTDADFTRPRTYEEGETIPPDAAPEMARPGRGRERGQRGGGAPRDQAPREERGPRPERGERGDRGERGGRGERRHRDDEPRIEPDINAEEVDFAAQTVDDLLRILDIGGDISIREPVTPGDGLGSVLAVIDISGEDLGLLIGRRGDTLISMQYLVNLIVARKYPGRGGVTIDVEHYRHRNEERIVSLANRMAERVRETGSPITLEPMSASERRLVHIIFAEDPDLETNSVGEGENRKVVISSRH